MRRVKSAVPLKLTQSPLNYFNAVNVPSLHSSDVLSESLFAANHLAELSLCSCSLSGVADSYYSLHRIYNYLFSIILYYMRAGVNDNFFLPAIISLFTAIAILKVKYRY